MTTCLCSKKPIHNEEERLHSTAGMQRCTDNLFNKSSQEIHIRMFYYTHPVIITPPSMWFLVVYDVYRHIV